MSRQWVGELKDGDSVDEVFLLAEKQIRANRNANLYLLAQLRDRTGTISGLMWNVHEDSCDSYEAGDFVHVKGKCQLYQGGLQTIVTRVDKVEADGVAREDFEIQPKADIEKLMLRMKEILLGVADPAVRSLMECFLIDDDLTASMTQTGAGIKAHHAYPGGLVEHITNMLEVALRIEDLYPDVNFSLVLAGIFLHDLGKVREMSFENSFSYTDEGQLLGHMSIGVEMVTEKIAQVERMTGEKFPEETALRIKHMIISHHGSYEHGSSRLPMTPEAIVLHHLDNLDAKVYEFAQTIDSDPVGESNWTPFIPRLDRKIFKGARTDGTE